jgi:ACS family hexuronate transporter-like MFS transporter
MIMNWFIGKITTEGSYTPAFIAITISVILGVLSIFVFIKNIEPVRKTVEE